GTDEFREGRQALAQLTAGRPFELAAHDVAPVEQLEYGHDLPVWRSRRHGPMAVRGRNLRFDVPGGGEPCHFPDKATVLGNRIIWIKSRSVKKIALWNHSPGFTFFGQASPQHPFSRSGPGRQYRNAQSRLDKCAATAKVSSMSLFNRLKP